MRSHIRQFFAFFSAILFSIHCFAQNPEVLSKLQGLDEYIVLPLSHFHYDRFDTPNDEEKGLYSLNYFTNPQGDIDRIVVSLDENKATFVRKPDESLSDPATLALFAGKYELAGNISNVILKNGNELSITSAGSPGIKLTPYKARIFHTTEFADYTVEFTIVNGVVTSVIEKDPSGEYISIKK